MGTIYTTALNYAMQHPKELPPKHLQILLTSILLKDNQKSDNFCSDQVSVQRISKWTRISPKCVGLTIHALHNKKLINVSTVPTHLDNRPYSLRKSCHFKKLRSLSLGEILLDKDCLYSEDSDDNESLLNLLSLLNSDRFKFKPTQLDILFKLSKYKKLTLKGFNNRNPDLYKNLNALIDLEIIKRKSVNAHNLYEYSFTDYYFNKLKPKSNKKILSTLKPYEFVPDDDVISFTYEIQSSVFMQNHVTYPFENKLTSSQTKIKYNKYQLAAYKAKKCAALSKEKLTNPLVINDVILSKLSPCQLLDIRDRLFISFCKNYYDLSRRLFNKIFDSFVSINRHDNARSQTPIAFLPNAFKNFCDKYLNRLESNNVYSNKTCLLNNNSLIFNENNHLTTCQVNECRANYMNHVMQILSPSVEKSSIESKSYQNFSLLVKDYNSRFPSQKPVERKPEKINIFKETDSDSRFSNGELFAMSDQDVLDKRLTGKEAYIRIQLISTENARLNFMQNKEINQILTTSKHLSQKEYNLLPYQSVEKDKSKKWIPW